MSIDPRYGIVLNNTSYSDEPCDDSDKMATWKTIEEFPDHEINPRGDIRKIGKTKIRKAYFNQTGILCIGLRKGGRTYCRSVGKLAREAWGYYCGE